MKPYLTATRIKAINTDIFTFVQQANRTTIDGRSLIWIYEQRNGVHNHNFDESENYQIHIKEGNYVLVTKIEKQLNSKRKRNV